MTPFCKFSKY